jgi:hypothetical protein
MASSVNCESFVVLLRGAGARGSNVHVSVSVSPTPLTTGCSDGVTIIFISGITSTSASTEESGIMTFLIHKTEINRMGIPR